MWNCSTEGGWNRNDASRGRGESIAIDAIDNRLAQCEYLIGELNSGKHYVITRSGKAKEFASWMAAAQFLIRNRYVSSRKGAIPESQAMQ